MKVLSTVAYWLLVIGGLNWLLVGVLGKDLFTLLNLQGTVATVVYVLVGLSTLVVLWTTKCKCGNCPACKANA